MKEANIQAKIMLKLSKLGHYIFRNNTGGGAVGRVVARARSYKELLSMVKGMQNKEGSYLVIRNGQECRMGLAPYSSDLIGFTKDGKFISLEVKKPENLISEELFKRHQTEYMKLYAMSRDGINLTKSQKQRLTYLKYVIGQKNWIDHVKMVGGVAGFVTSVEDAEKLL